MSKFVSVPHEIEAIQFGSHHNPPAWFHDMVRCGRVTVTMGFEGKCYFTVYEGDTATRGNHGDWLCYGPGDVVSVVSADQMCERYKPA